MKQNFRHKHPQSYNYDWLGDAHLILKLIENGRSEQDIAIQLRRDPKEISNALLAIEEADLYLTHWVKEPKQYQLVEDGEQFFRDIARNIKGGSEELKNASRAIAWTIFQNRDNIEGRIYRFNKAFGSLAPKVLERLEDSLSISNEVDETQEDSEFEIDIETDSVDSFTPIVNTLKVANTNEDILDTLIDACETTMELDKDKGKQQKPLKIINAAYSKLAGVDIDVASKDTYPAIRKQIESIRTVLKKIESKIT